MGDTTISWTRRPGTRGRTWNVTQGCALKSEGCRNCYAMRIAARFAVNGWSKGLINLQTKKWSGETNFANHKLAEPLGWRDPSTVFVNSMSDLFYEGFTNEQIAAVFGVMAACRLHTFIILTKRAQRMREWFEWAHLDGERFDMMRFGPSALLTCAWEACASEMWGDDSDDPFGGLPNAETFGTTWPLPNVWTGVSVENQAAADERIPPLLETPAVMRLLSCEPLLGPVDARLTGCFHEGAGTPARPDELENHSGCAARIGWVIAGCESGPGPHVRDCDADWLRSLRDQCASAGVPYFLKQGRPWDVGKHRPVPMGIGYGPGATRKLGGIVELPYLDGQQYAEWPQGLPKEQP